MTTKTGSNKKPTQTPYPANYDGSTPLIKPQQDLFCSEFMVDRVQTAAARRAGYKCPARTANRLMDLRHVKIRIQYLTDEYKKQNWLNIDYVLTGIKEIIDTTDEDNVKLTAYDKLGKHLQMWTDRLMVGELPKRIVIRNESGEVEEELKGEK